MEWAIIVMIAYAPVIYSLNKRIAKLEDKIRVLENERGRSLE